MMLYQQVADSDLLGKPQGFIYLESRDELMWNDQRASHAWTHHSRAAGESTTGIAGGTLLGKRAVLEDVPFSELRRGGSDTDFALRARAAGYDLMVTDPFNFAFFRSGDSGFHTWNTSVAGLRKQSRKIGGGATLESTVFV